MDNLNADINTNKTDIDNWKAAVEDATGRLAEVAEDRKRATAKAERQAALDMADQEMREFNEKWMDGERRYYEMLD